MEGTAQVVCGAVGLLGAVSALPLFLFLLLVKPGPASVDGQAPEAVPAERKGQGRRTDPERQGLMGGDHRAGSHLGSKHGHSPHEEGTQGRGQRGRGPAPKSKEKAVGHVSKGTATAKGSKKEPPQKVADGRPKGAGKPEKTPEKKGLIEKIEDKAGLHREECPRCTHLIVITEKTRPLKTRCPECNMIIVVK